MKETELIREQARGMTTAAIRAEIARIRHARTVAANRAAMDRYDVRESLFLAELSARRQRSET